MCNSFLQDVLVPYIPKRVLSKEECHFNPYQTLLQPSYQAQDSSSITPTFKSTQQLSEMSTKSSSRSPLTKAKKLHPLISKTHSADTGHSPQTTQSCLIETDVSASFASLEALQMHLSSRIAEIDSQISSRKALIQGIARGHSPTMRDKNGVKGRLGKSHKESARNPSPASPTAKRPTLHKSSTSKERQSPVINRLRNNLGKVQHLSKQFEPKTIPKMKPYTPKTALSDKVGISCRKKRVSFVVSAENVIEHQSAKETIDLEKQESVRIQLGNLPPKTTNIALPSSSLSPDSGSQSTLQSSIATEPDIDDILCQLQVKPVPIHLAETCLVSSFGNDEIFEKPNITHSPLTTPSTTSTAAVSSPQSPLTRSGICSQASELRKMYFELMDNTLILRDTDLSIPNSEDTQESSYFALKTDIILCNQDVNSLATKVHKCSGTTKDVSNSNLAWIFWYTAAQFLGVSCLGAYKYMWDLHEDTLRHENEFQRTGFGSSRPGSVVERARWCLEIQGHCLGGR